MSPIACPAQASLKHMSERAAVLADGKINSKRPVRLFFHFADFLAQALRAFKRHRRNLAEPAGVGDGGGQVGVRQIGSSPLNDWICNAEQLGHSRVPFHRFIPLFDVTLLLLLVLIAILLFWCNILFFFANEQINAIMHLFYF